MVEHGKVKNFFARRGYGFLTVLDEQGKPTGEEIFFHLNASRQTGMARGYSRLTVRHNPVRQPQPGEFIVFDRGQDRMGRSCAAKWAYRSDWDRNEATLTEVRELNWQIVLHEDVPTGFVRFAGTDDETSREEFVGVVFSGTRRDSIRESCRWKAADLRFYEDDPRAEYLLQGIEANRATYYLQVKLSNGKWSTIKSIEPVPDPYYYDDGYEDENPLAGDVDPTGGYYGHKPDPFEAQLLSVMRQHGDYTGW